MNEIKAEIVGGEHGFPKKPAPDAALYLAEKYKKVVEITEQLKEDSFQIASAPRTTGNGYFESVALDFDGNLIEITA